MKAIYPGKLELKEHQLMSTLLMDGCQLATPSKLFLLVYEVSNGNPCGTGCAYNQDGKCPAFLKHHSYPKMKIKQEQDKKEAEEKAKAMRDGTDLIGGKWKGMSIKQIAAVEGISLNKARDNKLAGRYRE